MISLKHNYKKPYLAHKKGDSKMIQKRTVLTLAVVLVLLAGCVTAPHTYTDKKKVKLVVPGCV